MTINSKEKSDYYYIKAKNEGYRARSVYKLLDINETYHIFDNSVNVIDLCAAPGSWSQCVLRNFKSVKNLISVDLQDIAEFNEFSEANVFIMKEDITSDKFINNVNNLNIPIDTVICDGAPDVTGIHELDEYLQFDILKACLELICSISKINLNNFTFTCKIFRGEFTAVLIRHFKKFFEDVLITKPRSSRGYSRECFLICKNFISREDSNLIDFSPVEGSYICETCGYGPDPDYKFDETVTTGIRSKPINPPYEEALNERLKKLN